MKHDRGRDSETLACRHLEQHGLVLLERNWRCRFGEIDLVLRDGACIVFVEVRLRTGVAYGGAAESIDRRKRAKLLAAARLYLAGKPAPACRFDVVLLQSLDPPRIEWIRNAISE
jgi:putative endonuclease